MNTEDAILERDKAWAECSKAVERAEALAEDHDLLGTILAVILGDGGHRQAAVGSKQATAEALEAFYALVRRADHFDHLISIAVRDGGAPKP